MDNKTREERLRGINEMLVHVRNELSDFMSADDPTLTPGNVGLTRRLIRLEYHLSKYLDRKPND